MIARFYSFQPYKLTPLNPTTPHGLFQQPMNTKNILALCGSTRGDSTNHRILRHLTRSYSNSMTIRLYDGMTDLPYFNPDLDTTNSPAIVAEFREQVQQADGILICTPEYVFSIPGVLKNALEWLVSTTIMDKKPTALITASALGEKGHESLLLVLRTIGAYLPESNALLISGVRAKIDENGQARDEGTAAALLAMMESFRTNLGLL